jgi:protein ImuB
MLWLALRFPSLPLEIFARAAASPGPLAVSSSPGANADIVACNARARSCGVRPGMPVAAAYALTADLRIHARDAAAERATVERIAACAIQYSPTVSIAEASEVLIEIGGSLRVFGGLNCLWTRIEQELDNQGHTFFLACAPTPLAAQFFARARLPVRIQHDDALRTSIGQLSVDVLGLPPGSDTLLADIGASTIGDCLRLPRAGLARRAGEALLDMLDRALGYLPDPRPAFAPPSRFTAALQLPALVETAPALLFAARRLLAELTGFLAAVGKGAQRLRLVLSHEDREATCIELDLAAATRDPDHLAAVLRERLDRLALPSPATAIKLQSVLLAPLAARNLALLPDAREQAETIVRLIERLRARLGENAVQGLDIAADHRPEYAWRTDAGVGQGREPGASNHGAWLPLSRPLWVLHAPRPLADLDGKPQQDGPLALIAGPERIEAGWWDDNDIAREYYVARNPAQSLLWIYRECRAGCGWYLHGYFA